MQDFGAYSIQQMRSNSRLVSDKFRAPPRRAHFALHPGR
jgi:hypothetical protein